VASHFTTGVAERVAWPGVAGCGRGRAVGDRAWLVEGGLPIRFEYDRSKGNASEVASGVYKLVLGPEQWFGFSVTLMHRRR